MSGTVWGLWESGINMASLVEDKMKSLAMVEEEEDGFVFCVEEPKNLAFDS